MEPGMKSSVRSLAVLALAFTAIPAAAQDRPAARLTPYVGFLAAGSIAEGPFGFDVGNAGAPVYGVQLGINLTRNLALVGNVGYSDSELQAGIPFIGGIGLADSKMLLYDGGVQLRFPAVTGGGTGFVPYVEGGVGAIRHEITVGPVRTQSTNVAFIMGGGVDLQLTNALGLRVMAKDHVSRFDYGEAIGLSNEGRRAHNWVLGLGLNVGW
jgi:opacity protein-like surface antigen